MRKRINGLPWFDFQSAFQVNDAQQTGTTEFGRLRKTHNLQQRNQSSVFTLPSTIAHSRREPQRIVTQMMTVSRALCLAMGGPHPSVQSASYMLKHNNYSAVAPAYLIIKSVSKRPLSMFLPEKNSETMFAGISAI
jgi:hypothetical protein